MKGNKRKAQSILAKAVKLLQKEGWIQKSSFQKGKGYCAYGALRQAAFGNPFIPRSDADINPSFNRARNALMLTLGGVLANDSPKTTKKFVIAKMLEAKEKL